MPYAEVNDTRLHIRQAGTGPVALFIHGFPLDSTMWIEQMAYLSDIRRCIAPDLRGFGRSAPVTGAPLTMEQHAEDCAAVLDLVSAEKADIIGLSMGGYAAMAFADMFPDRVRSLALIDTRAGADSDEAKAGRDAMAVRVIDEGRSAIAVAMESGLLGPDASISARARVRSMVEGCLYETIVGALGGMRDRADRNEVLRRVTVPAAVVVGEMDEVTPPEEAAAMADALPDASLTVIPGSGHLSPIESPAAVNEAIGALLARTDQEGAA